LGLRLQEIVKKSTLGLKPDILDVAVMNVIHEALLTYYPEDDLVTKVRLDFSGSTFPGAYNTTFGFSSKSNIYMVGNLTFLFTSLSQFNDAFAEFINSDELLEAEVDGTEIIITLPSFISADFFTLIHTDAGQAIVVTSTVEQRGVEACTNCLDEEEICQLINFAQKEIHKESC
jgi:hypothetical protein